MLYSFIVSVTAGIQVVGLTCCILGLILCYIYIKYRDHF
jgi:hypothetical protein